MTIGHYTIRQGLNYGVTLRLCELGQSRIHPVLIFFFNKQHYIWKYVRNLNETFDELSPWFPCLGVKVRSIIKLHGRYYKFTMQLIWPLNHDRHGICRPLHDQ